MGPNLPEGHGGPAVNRDFEDLGGANPYELLGVPPDADTTQIKLAYRFLVQTMHSDRGGNEESLKRLNLAREVLLDPARRIDIDHRLRQQRGESDGIHREAPNPEPHAAPSTSQFAWTYGTGPAQHSASQPTPEPLETPYEDQFTWKPGTGPSPQQAQREQHTDPERAEPSPPYQWQHVQYETTYRHYGYPPAQRNPYRRRWNRLAVASLVMTFVFWPLALPLAVSALVQIRRRNERGANLAWLAIALGVLVLCIVLIGIGRN